MSGSSHFPQQDRGSLAEFAWQARSVHLNNNDKIDQELENHAASGWSLSAWKRLLDVIIAITVLTVFALPLLIIAICVRLSSNGPALFVQKRVGRSGKQFDIYKFRSMALSAECGEGPKLTRDGDSRITGIGRWLRKLKLDEIPQFYNVLRGDMSLIGPRPKLLQYAESLNMPYRPGITGAATLAFRNEEEILRAVHPAELDRFYELRVKPVKAQIDTDYMRRATFWTDWKLVGLTFVACLMPSRVPTAFHTDPDQAAPVAARDVTIVIRIPIAVPEIAGESKTGTS